MPGDSRNQRSAGLSNMNTNWEGPVFIVGMPRSGTKLLRSLLTRHARIRIPTIETEFLPFLEDWVARRGPASDEDSFARLFGALRNATYFDYRASQQPAFAWKDWRSACRGRFDVAGLFEGFIRYETNTAPGSGVIWGDKSPSYIRLINLLLATFPHARIVHIVRDIRDVSASTRKAWGKDVARAAHRWGKDVLTAHHICECHPDRCIELRYEALTSGPEGEMVRLCEFLEVEFDRSLIELDRPTEKLGDAKGQIGVVRGNSRKYRRNLTAREIELVESLAWDAMTALGYQPEAATGPRTLGRLSMALRRMKDGANLVIRDVEARGFRRSLLFYLHHQRFNN
jgi:Sulfotransferase family